MTLALLLALAACAPPKDAVSGDAAVVVSLEVDPPSARITSGPAGAGTADFEAIATFDDGTVAPIDLVSWELSNQAAGRIDPDGLFTAATENGSLTDVIATHDGIAATAALTVVYEETIDEGSGLSAAAFDGTPTGTVDWLYPADGVAVPRNVPSLGFIWSAVPGAEGYRLSFSTPTTAITVLTTDNRWTAEAERWTSIAATNAGGQVTVDVRALAGGTLSASEPRTLTVNRLDAQGSIYYWSTTDNGVIKVPIAAESGEIYYTPLANSPACVACHVIRGDRMGVSYGGRTGVFYTGITDISSGEPVELTAADTQGYFNTLNPAGTRMISTTPTGVLNLWNAETGALIGPIAAGGAKLTQPDWSPDGTRLVAIESAELFCDTCFSDGKLVVATIDDDGNLGPLTELLDPVATFGRGTYGKPNVFYPAFSPDGEWIVFDYGNQQSYDNESAQLYVISAHGGDPIPLDNANGGEGLTNSWPHWGPLPDDDVYWITYSSKRPYGDLVTDGRPQIWVAAFDPTLAAAGGDPSSPAFWLPNQNMETSNHSTFWGP